MTYEQFTDAVSRLTRRTGSGDARFSIDEHKKYIAVLQDGVIITGNPVTLGFTVRYGSGHQMMTKTL